MRVSRNGNRPLKHVHQWMSSVTTISSDTSPPPSLMCDLASLPDIAQQNLVTAARGQLKDLMILIARRDGHNPAQRVDHAARRAPTAFGSTGRQHNST
jgi:hypothetical protein